MLIFPGVYQVVIFQGVNPLYIETYMVVWILFIYWCVDIHRLKHIVWKIFQYVFILGIGSIGKWYIYLHECLVFMVFMFSCRFLYDGHGNLTASLPLKK